MDVYPQPFFARDLAPARSPTEGFLPYVRKRFLNDEIRSQLKEPASSNSYSKNGEIRNIGTHQKELLKAHKLRTWR
jgi:hypothetical protein